MADFQRIDDFALALMASAPIARCTCPTSVDHDCDANRCAACYDTLLLVVDWAHSNVYDTNGQWIARNYIRRALLNSPTRWNAVRRGLMTALPTPTIAIEVRVENALICTICFDNVQPELSLHLPCNHAFHRVCITTWLHMQRTCPVCRTAI